MLVLERETSKLASDVKKKKQGGGAEIVVAREKKQPIEVGFPVLFLPLFLYFF